MKVLLINNCFWRRGGSETVFFGTADLLKEMGHKVVFFSINDSQNINTDVPSYFIERGGKFSQVKEYFNNTKASEKLKEILEKEKPDIAHVHLFWGGISPSIFDVLHQHRVPLIHTVHDYRMICPAYTFRDGRGEVCEKCRTGKFIECFKGRCSKGSLIQSLIMATEMYYRNKKWHPANELDGIIYVSHFAKKKHEEFESKFCDVKNIVLYNFSNVGKTYSPAEEDAGYYLYYGRLSHEKGVATLIEAFSRHSGLTLKVIGTGPQEEELKHNRYHNIEFLGYKIGEELYNLVRNARFVIVPSEWYENNPMTIVEAYSLGVPVIGANIGGIPEIIEDGKTGFLFESGNTESLLRALDRSIEVNKEKYSSMKQFAFLFARTHFDCGIYKEELMRFYNQIIKEYNTDGK